MTTQEKTSADRPSLPDNEIIERFGGIRPMATKLGVAVTTVQGWKERGHIPDGRFAQIAKAAAEHGIDLGQPAQAPSSQTPGANKIEPAEPETVSAAESEAKPEPTEDVKAAATASTERGASAVRSPESAPAGGGVSWAAMIAIVLLLGVAIVTAPLWTPQIYPGLGGGGLPTDGRQLDEIAAGLNDIETAMQDLGRDLDSRQSELSDRIDALEAGGGEAGAAFAGQLNSIERSLNDLSDKLASLDSDLTNVGSRIARLEANEGKVPESVETALAETDSSVDELKGEVGSIRTTTRDVGTKLSAMGAKIDGLEDRVSELESRPVQTGEKIAAMVLALGQVESAFDAGRSYREALDRLKLLASDDPVIAEGEAVAALSPWADSGIPDRVDLRRRFAELAPEIDREISETKDGTWLDSVWDRIAGLVTIRRIDGSDLSPIAQAERALDEGDLSAAAAAFEGEGSLGAEGDAWLNMVRARIKAEREIDELYAQMIVPLAGESGAEGPATQ